MTLLTPTIKFFAFAHPITVRADKPQEFLLLDGDCENMRAIRVQRCQKEFNAELDNRFWLPCNVVTKDGTNALFINIHDACRVLNCSPQELTKICQNNSLTVALHNSLPSKIKNLVKQFLQTPDTDYANILSFAYAATEEGQTYPPKDIVDLWKITATLLPTFAQNMVQALNRATALQNSLPMALRETSRLLLINQIATAILSTTDNPEEGVTIALQLTTKAESLDIPTPEILDFTVKLHALVQATLPYLDNSYEQALEIFDENRFKHLRTKRGETLEIYKHGCHYNWSVFRLLNKEKKGDKLIGQGTYAKAKLCINILTGNTYCRISDTQTTSSLMLQSLTRHRGIVEIQFIANRRYYSKKDSKVTKQALIEKLYTSNLKEYLSHNALNLDQKTKIALDLLHGLAYLHNHGIVHNDIKDKNVLIKIEGTICEAVLADFNLADFAYSVQYGGSKEFLAPEWLNYSYFQGSAPINYYAKDIYAMGITLLRLFANELQSSPIREFSTLNEQLTDAPRAELFKRYEPPSTDSSLAHFIYKFLRYRPTERIFAFNTLDEFKSLIVSRKFKRELCTANQN